MPVLAFSHSWTEPIGKATRVVRDDETALVLEFRVDDHEDVPRARHVLAQLKSGTLTEVSVGFQAVSSYVDVDGVKHFERAALNEVSVVIRGAVPGAEVLAVRSAERRRRMHYAMLAGRVSSSEWRRATQAARLVDDTTANEANEVLERLGLA